MAAKKSGRKSKKELQQEEERREAFKREIFLWVLIAASLLMFISNLGIGGAVGGVVSSIMFGVFGFMAYIVPVLLLFGSVFAYVNRGNRLAVRILAASVFMLLFICMFVSLMAHGANQLSPVQEYLYSVEHKFGGGFLGGCLAWLFSRAFGTAGAYIIDIIGVIVCLILITGRSAVGGMARGGQKVMETAQEVNEERRSRRSTSSESRIVRGVTMNTKIVPDEPAPEAEPAASTARSKSKAKEKRSAASMPDAAEAVGTERTLGYASDGLQELYAKPGAFSDEFEEKLSQMEQAQVQPKSEVPPQKGKKSEKRKHVNRSEAADNKTNMPEYEDSIAEAASDTQDYILPPVDLLEAPKQKSHGGNPAELRETANKLQETLETFGVKVAVTNVSCGPTVTLYEIQPEAGVKVSKIVNLADDIKLNLAAADIRIEAPIPGKAAIGIEVPNKENVTVSFREMVESEEFKTAKSKISFAVGKDLSGRPVVADIAKMPHVLIAGATGSGKSVCINTIIMSVLYHARPDEVKMILIDPKVVELNVYRGIPHLMIDVVTDPKKAAAALNWAVEEMSDRYQKFADAGVRKFDEYNEKISRLPVPEGQDKPDKMPQILIVVDELADLMMVASHEVEDSICRLAQLARAAGIHLVIATQRPSVNVITGLIKANMPSRIAFAVTSGIDSRTILDMIGAEKLLGKGDMLFYPQGLPKPVRVQGALVTDEEVAKVVAFIKEQNGTVTYRSDVQEKVANYESGAGQAVTISDAEPDDGRDVYFIEAARLVADKEKASIGMFQRAFKIGFNRAARIMDQLEEAGIVGPEIGTKPRNVLMSPEELQDFIDG